GQRRTYDHHPRAGAEVVEVFPAVGHHQQADHVVEQGRGGDAGEQGPGRTGAAFQEAALHDAAAAPDAPFVAKDAEGPGNRCDGGECRRDDDALADVELDQYLLAVQVVAGDVTHRIGELEPGDVTAPLQGEQPENPEHRSQHRRDGAPARPGQWDRRARTLLPLLAGCPALVARRLLPLRPGRRLRELAGWLSSWRPALGLLRRWLRTRLCPLLGLPRRPRLVRKIRHDRQPSPGATDRSKALRWRRTDRR